MADKYPVSNFIVISPAVCYNHISLCITFNRWKWGMNVTHKEKANELLRQKYHCSQALFGAFAEDFGLDSRLAFKLSTCFGAGLRMGETCGCVTASMMILGLAFGFYDTQDRELEMYGNRRTREFMERFKEAMGGSNLCRDILQQDFATREGREVIKQAGLILKRCPKPIEASIDIADEQAEPVPEKRRQPDLFFRAKNCIYPV